MESIGGKSNLTFNGILENVSNNIKQCQQLVKSILSVHLFKESHISSYYELLFLLRSDQNCRDNINLILSESCFLELKSYLPAKQYRLLQSFVDGQYKFIPGAMPIEAILSHKLIANESFIQSIFIDLFKNKVNFKQLSALYDFIADSDIGFKNQLSSLAFFDAIINSATFLMSEEPRAKETLANFISSIKNQIFGHITKSSYNSSESESHEQSNIQEVFSVNVYDHISLPKWLEDLKKNEIFKNKELIFKEDYWWLGHPIIFVAIIDRLLLSFDIQERAYSPFVFNEKENGDCSDDGENYLDSRIVAMRFALQSDFKPLDFVQVKNLYFEFVTKSNFKEHLYSLSTSENLITAFNKINSGIIDKIPNEQIKDILHSESATTSEFIVMNRDRVLGGCKVDSSVFMNEHYKLIKASHSPGFYELCLQNPYLKIYIDDCPTFIARSHYPSEQEVINTFNKFVEEFNSSINKSKGVNDRIKAIEIFVAKFEMSHFFINGNVRLALIMRMKLYQQYDLPFSILQIINGWSSIVLASYQNQDMSFIVNLVKEGMYWWYNNIEMEK